MLSCRRGFLKELQGLSSAFLTIATYSEFDQKEGGEVGRVGKLGMNPIERSSRILVRRVQSERSERYCHEDQVVGWWVTRDDVM